MLYYCLCLASAASNHNVNSVHSREQTLLKFPACISRLSYSSGKANNPCRDLATVISVSEKNLWFWQFCIKLGGLWLTKAKALSVHARADPNIKTPALFSKHCDLWRFPMYSSHNVPCLAVNNMLWASFQSSKTSWGFSLTTGCKSACTQANEMIIYFCVGIAVYMNSTLLTMSQIILVS
jgi:hypothetical protein